MMDLVNAFLMVSGLAYFCILPFKSTWNLSEYVEKLSFTVAGSTIILVTVYPCPRSIYYALSLVYVFASMMSWLEIMEWRTEHLLKDSISHGHQLAMFAWDLLIAICFMLKS